MVLDTIIVAVVVAGAAAYLAWSLVPKRAKRTLPACSGCAQAESHRQAVPVRTRWTG
jgi:Flp pilus assembly protein CpaB